jgi:hypothetical protein
VHKLEVTSLFIFKSFPLCEFDHLSSHYVLKVIEACFCSVQSPWAYPCEILNRDVI